jgi:hypothetical protein
LDVSIVHGSRQKWNGLKRKEAQRSTRDILIGESSQHRGQTAVDRTKGIDVQREEREVNRAVKGSRTGRQRLESEHGEERVPEWRAEWRAEGSE